MTEQSWTIDIKEDRSVVVDGKQYDTYGIRLQQEIDLLSKKGLKSLPKKRKLEKLLKQHSGK